MLNNVLWLLLGMAIFGLGYCGYRFFLALAVLTTAVNSLVAVLKPLMDNKLLDKGLNGVNLLAEAMPGIFERLDSVVATFMTFNKFAFAEENPKTIRPVQTPSVTNNSGVFPYSEAGMAKLEEERDLRQAGWEVSPEHSPQRVVSGVEVAPTPKPQSTPA